MTTIDDMRKKYPGVNFYNAPNVNCKVCHGTGEHLNGFKELTFCICTFVDHEFSNLAADCMKDAINKLKHNRR
jgi:hypothetical protein